MLNNSTQQTAGKAKVIKLHKTDIDAYGILNIWRIYPTAAGRKRAAAQFKSRYPMLDYSNTWRDVNGFGLHMSVYIPTLVTRLTSK